MAQERGRPQERISDTRANQIGLALKCFEWAKGDLVHLSSARKDFVQLPSGFVETLRRLDRLGSLVLGVLQAHRISKPIRDAMFAVACTAPKAASTAAQRRATARARARQRTIARMPTRDAQVVRAAYATLRQVTGKTRPVEIETPLIADLSLAGLTASEITTVLHHLGLKLGDNRETELDAVTARARREKKRRTDSRLIRLIEGQPGKPNAARRGSAPSERRRTQPQGTKADNAANRPPCEST